MKLIKLDISNLNQTIEPEYSSFSSAGKSERFI